MKTAQELLTELNTLDEHLTIEAKTASDVGPSLMETVCAFDNSTYRDINREADTLSASKHLRKLCDCGLLSKKGNGPATYYVPTERALENWPPGASTGAKSQELRGKSTDLYGKSTEFIVKSTELPTELRDRIAGTGRKTDKSALLQLVVDILTERPLSASELAEILGRTQKHIRTEYLQPLLDEGRVERSNPEKPTDPNQTYFARKIREEGQ